MNSKKVVITAVVVAIALAGIVYTAAAQPFGLTYGMDQGYQNTNVGGTYGPMMGFGVQYGNQPAQNGNTDGQQVPYNYYGNYACPMMGY